MLTVEDDAKIRRAHRDGMSVRTIAKKYHHSRKKIREALQNPEPEPYTRRWPAPAPKLGPFTPVIDEILQSDEQAPPKQRHTATQIFRRLRREGYPGGYDQVRRYVARHRRVTRETFLPLSHDPGQRVEADFGHIYVDFPEGRRQVPVLLVTWAHSYRSFAIALPTERVEAILHGMCAAFEWFGCVPKEVWWDNPKTVATAILVGRVRTLHRRYLALASHYNFEPLFCMPARGNEKPYAENRVKHLQRHWATPVPRVKDLTELNHYLRECCRRDLERVATGQRETIGRRFGEDLAAALPLPEHPFDTCLRGRFVMRHGFRLALFVVIVFLPFLVLCAAAGWMVARGFLPDTNKVLLIPMAGIAAAIYAILYATRRRLRRQFRLREAISFEQWFEEYYGKDDVSPEVARVVAELVAKGVGRGVQPTRILPTDRLNEDFTYRLFGTAIDQGVLLADPLEYLFEELAERFEEMSSPPLAPDPAWNTIDEVIRGLSARIGCP